MKVKIIKIITPIICTTLFLAGCGKKSDTNINYNKYFESLKDNDTNLINMEYSFDIDESLTDRKDINNFKYEILYDKNNQNEIYSIISSDNKASYIKKEDMIYVEQGDKKYKIKSDDYTVSDTENTYFDYDELRQDADKQSLLDIIQSQTLYIDKLDNYSYLETIEKDDKKIDILTTKNTRNKVNISEKGNISTNNDENYYLIYVNQDTKLPEKLTHIIKKDSKKIELSCELSYPDKITIENENDYIDGTIDEINNIKNDIGITIALINITINNCF